jgi:CRISPR-associated protein (TIGR02584 family)
MENEATQTVLISLVGATPAVLTETVWALAKQPEPVIPDRVIALAPSLGAERLRNKLFEEGHWERMLEDLKGQGLLVEGKLKFGPIADSIRVFPNLSRSKELDDIRSLEDNQAVAEFFMETIRSFTENDSVRLIVSIAGGRKTASALLHSVMTLVGRAQDQINHILIDEAWVYQEDFLYPGCTGKFVDKRTGKKIASKDAKLELVDVPFVPLRYLFKRDLERSAGSFMELINQVRTRSINVDEDLIVQLGTERGTFNISGHSVSLSPNEFILYLCFALRVSNNQPPAESYASLEEDLRDLRSEYLREDDPSHWSHQALSSQFDANEDLRKWASNIRTKLKKAGFEPFQVDRLVPRGGHLAIDLPKENVEVDQ